MKGRQIILDTLGDREAAALLVDGVLDDLLVEPEGPRPGTIYRAIADRPVKGMGGMFLKTPDGMAFLRKGSGLRQGQPVLVQLTGFPEPGKALPVTQRILFKSRYAIVTPDAPGINLSRSIRDEDARVAILEVAHEVMDGPYGLILRSACEHADPEEIGEDIASVLALSTQVMADIDGPAELLVEGDGPHSLAWRDWTDPADVETDPGGFERLDVLDQIDRLASPGVPLGGGAEMYVEPTRALIAVDVNTGGDTSPAAGLKANMSAARLLPRALRLRGLGGQIVLDLAPMPKKDRRGFEAALRKAFRADSVETALVGWTPLGNYELQRQRGRAPLNWTV